jgi:uncharacterized protein (TIRG00374 family)
MDTPPSESPPAPPRRRPGWRTVALWTLKLAVLVGVLAFAGSQIELDDRVVTDPGPPPVSTLQPGLRTLAASLDYGLVLAAVLLAGPAPLLLALRWSIVLRAAGISVPYGQLLRLTFIGNFFNNFVPGGTGGDVVKAFAIARHTERRAEAVAMILLDRVLGMVGLTLMAAVAVLFRYQALGGLARGIGLFLLAVVTGVGLYLSPWVRRTFRIPALLERLPRPIRQIDAALGLALRRPRDLAMALATTIGMQALGIGAVALCGRALGITAAGYLDYLVLVPIAYLANSLPLSPGGLGLLEAALQQLLVDAGLASATQAFLTGLAARVLSWVWCLPGLVFWLAGGRHTPSVEAGEARRSIG